MRRSDLDSFLAASTSSDPNIDEELAGLSELLKAAGRGDLPKRVSALRDLAVAAEALTARMEAGSDSDAGKVDDARR